MQRQKSEAYNRKDAPLVIFRFNSILSLLRMGYEVCEYFVLVDWSKTTLARKIRLTLTLW